MGLLYPFPVDKSESDHVLINNTSIELRTYGLPYIFWGYLMGVLIIISFMFIGIYNPLMAIFKAEDLINHYLAYLVIATLLMVPLGFISLFFIEKRFIKSASELVIQTRIYGLKLNSQIIQLKTQNSFTVERFEGTPNMAKLENRPDLKGHQNKGYFELFAIDKNDKYVLIDRHSRKIDLEKLIQLLILR